MSELVTAIVSGAAGLAVGGAASAVQVWKVRKNAAEADMARKARDSQLVGEIRATGQAWIEYLLRTCAQLAGGQHVDESVFTGRADELRESAYRAMSKIPPTDNDDFFYGPFADQLRRLQQQVEDAVRRGDQDLARWLLDPGPATQVSFGDAFTHTQIQRRVSTEHLYRLIQRGVINLGSDGITPRSEE
ncbi:hypothetical protein [Streptomyces ardesiacus]|uniref:hypothetical protein n=1 Tax=Streptomyces ardesiacus TaxID=285564 RepID=UPI0036496F9A